MVIQSTMSPEAIIEVWDVTEEIFRKHNIPPVKQPLQKIVGENQLASLLQELNNAVGSSAAT